MDTAASLESRPVPFLRPLDILERTWADAAIALRSLLPGQWKSRGAKPLLAVGKIVQAYDQSSAEQDLRNRKGDRHQPWNAKPYTNNVREFSAYRQTKALPHGFGESRLYKAHSTVQLSSTGKFLVAK